MTEPTHLERPSVQILQAKPHDYPLEFLRDVDHGLSTSPKSIPSKYFYDKRGSELFEKICTLEEYYPTRTEYHLLKHIAPELIDRCQLPLTLVELGAGSSTKTTTIITAILQRQSQLDFYPLDISPTILEASGKTIRRLFPAVQFKAISAEYLEGLEMIKTKPSPKLFLWLGSSIGNFTPEESIRFLHAIHAFMQPNDAMVIGMDMVKDRDVLIAAYNDRAGVTAQFNLNLLERINRELGGHFDLQTFHHLALFNEAESRIEMYLESRLKQSIAIDLLNRNFSFQRGETIHTENSQKYTQDMIDAILERSGFTLIKQWMDDRNWFSVNLISAQ